MSLQPHLTHQQLCDLLLANPHDSSSRIEQLRHHLHDCASCAAEFSSLQQSLSLFRSATTEWANHAMISRSWPASLSLPTQENGVLHRFFARPVLWASAAAALLFATVIPLTLHHHRIPAQTQAVSTLKDPPQSAHADQGGDEALLEEIDQTLSSPIPTPMQPLADPTAGRSSQNNSTPRQN